MAETTLEGKVAVIGGGANNLGGLISRDLARHGADVLVHYHSDDSKADAEATVRDIEAMGRKAIPFQADLTEVSNCARLFETAVSELGRLDVAVNTAGKVVKKPIVQTDEQEYDAMFDINTKTAYFFIREAAERMNDDGTIITIGTSLLAAFTGQYALYAGSKAPLEHFARAAAKELGERGISVTTVAPGPMDTPFFYPAESAEAVEYHKSQTMNGKLTKIEDIAPIVRFLATEGWWITGQTIFANGGYTTR